MLWRLQRGRLNDSIHRSHQRRRRPIHKERPPNSPQQDLEELGMTSMEMVNLMLSIEAEFDLTIPSSKLVPANFRTIQNIDALVRDLAH
ncbi:phosphopantetheine-binding protein [Methylocystis sp. JR02]|uniref:phosphopantetheine-binding protein n=1 Tax=Methylocystis sp. JR02 TaxID=3046284 RepID=UPI0024BB86A5|nr:phosphopantetheine-binding protein [Methylocystis sp. JR02]MDJ0447200.1 phosphopantetheine-binding protein [Methylocystis sp. JR02]